MFVHVYEPSPRSTNDLLTELSQIYSFGTLQTDTIVEKLEQLEDMQQPSESRDITSEPTANTPSKLVEKKVISCSFLRERLTKFVSASR